MASISDRKVPFFTPVDYAKKPLMGIVDRYFWFGGKVAKVITPLQIESGSYAAKKVDGKTNMLETTLKVVSMILSLGVLPLLALVLKTILRSSHSYHFVQNPASQVPRPFTPPIDPVPPAGAPASADFARQLRLATALSRQEAEQNRQLLVHVPAFFEDADRLAYTIERDNSAGRDASLSVHYLSQIHDIFERLQRIPKVEILEYFANLRFAMQQENPFPILVLAEDLLTFYDTPQIQAPDDHLDLIRYLHNHISSESERSRAARQYQQPLDANAIPEAFAPPEPQDQELLEAIALSMASAPSEPLPEVASVSAQQPLPQEQQIRWGNAEPIASAVPEGPVMPSTQEREAARRAVWAARTFRT